MGRKLMKGIRRQADKQSHTPLQGKMLLATTHTNWGCKRDEAGWVGKAGSQ